MSEAKRRSRIIRAVAYLIGLAILVGVVWVIFDLGSPEETSAPDAIMQPVDADAEAAPATEVPDAGGQTPE